MDFAILEGKAQWRLSECEPASATAQPLGLNSSAFINLNTDMSTPFVPEFSATLSDL